MSIFYNTVTVIINAYVNLTNHLVFVVFVDHFGEVKWAGGTNNYGLVTSRFLVECLRLDFWEFLGFRWVNPQCSVVQ